MKTLLYAGILLLATTQQALAQQDPIPLLHLDTLPSISVTINQNTPPAKKVFPYTKFLVPVTLITYGVISLKSDGLQDWNEVIHEEIWTERPHKELHLDSYLQWGPAVMVYGLNLAGIHGKNNFRDRSIIFGMAELIQSSTVYTVKAISGEQRPNGDDGLSFPSGHTSNAFAGAEFLRKEYQDVSPWYGIAGYAMAATTGYLRMYNNKHWLGDIVAGAGVGILSTDIAYWIYPSVKRWLFKNKAMNTVIMPAYQNGAIGFGLVHHF
jgi:hypothetical protein